MAELWNLFFFEPMLNGIILLYSFLFMNFGLAIIAFTIFVRLVTFPLTQKQLKATRAMSAVQPKLKELQKKYAKNRQKLAQEQMKLYREAGMNPMGCMWPMLIQFPIWIALYQGIIRALPAVPEDLLALSGHLYSWEVVNRMVPLNDGFLWLNLGAPDPIMLLPILVAGTLWAQQKMITTPSADARQESMNRMMLWTMPLMFGLFSLQFPSGLALYWIISNFIGIVIQYFIGGWGGLRPSSPREKGSGYAKPKVQRQDRGRSHPARPPRVRDRPRGGRDNRAQEGQDRPLRTGLRGSSYPGGATPGTISD